MESTDYAYPDSFASAIKTAVTDSLRLPALAATLQAQLEELTRTGALARERWILTGSGDSLFAAKSARMALRHWTGRAVEVRSAIELARYETPLLDPDRDLVIAISNSGSSSRTRETIALARARGVTTLGITGSLDGPLAAMAEHVLHRPVAPVDTLPKRWGRVFLNMSEYLAALHALYELGLAVARQDGRMTADEAGQIRAEAGAVTASLAADAVAIEPAMAAFAEELREMRAIWSLGAGPSAGTAAYAAAKFHEQAPIAGITQDLEEWAHLEYFLTLGIGRDSVALVHAPPGASADRAAEIVDGVTGAGGVAIVVTSIDQPGFDAADGVARLSSVSEPLSPLSYHLPGQLLVVHIARLRDVPRIPLRRSDDYRLIRGGIVLTDPDGLIRPAAKAGDLQTT